MSQDFKTVLVKDDRIANLTDQMTFAVKKGGQNVNVYPYKAISATTSNIVFNIQVPSKTTLIDRRVMLKSTIKVNVAVPGAGFAIGDAYLQPGYNFSLGCFPLQSTFSTMSMTINSNTITINIADVLPALMTMLDNRELSRYQGATANKRDSYFNYADAVGAAGAAAANSPFAGWDTCVDPDLASRGSYAIDSITGNVCAVAGQAGNVSVTFTVYEPLLLSPLIWGNPHTNNGALYGITALTFLFNVGSANRVIRTAVPGCVATLDPTNPYTNTTLYLQYLTCHPSDLISSKCVSSYLELPRYINSSQPTLPAAVVANGIITPGKATFTSQSLQLNQCPDKLIIFVRDNQANINNSSSDHFFSIENVSFNWNNQSGLMSSFSMYDLWRASVDAGSNLTWNEWSGRATMSSPSAVAANAVGQKPLCGSVLVVDMAYTLQLTDDFLAPGSIGAFNLQFKVDVANYDAVDHANCELVLITMNSGYISIENGASSVFTAILSKSDVLDASEQTAMSENHFKRQVGSGFLDTLKSVGKALAPLARQAIGASDNKYMKGADSVLKSFGLGHSGGGPSGGSALRAKINKY